MIQFKKTGLRFSKSSNLCRIKLKSLKRTSKATNSNKKNCLRVVKTKMMILMSQSMLVGSLVSQVTNQIKKIIKTKQKKKSVKLMKINQIVSQIIIPPRSVQLKITHQ